MKQFEAKVTGIIQETSDSYSFQMEIPSGYSWNAGQHTMFAFKDHKLKEDERTSRIFTIASAPEDGYLMFTTRIADQHSEFKDVLLNKVRTGDIILVSEPLGSYDLHFDDNTSSVIAAGGIGITPIRSLIRHYSDHNDETHPIRVLYSDNRKEYAYGDFWNDMKSKMPNLEIVFHSSTEEFTADVLKYAEEHGNRAEYLIAGSPGMNNAFSKSLGEAGISTDRIITDVFIGY